MAAVPGKSLINFERTRYDTRHTLHVVSMRVSWPGPPLVSHAPQSHLRSSKHKRHLSGTSPCTCRVALRIIPLSPKVSLSVSEGRFVDMLQCVA
jgi:hypothetical protein